VDAMEIHDASDAAVHPWYRLPVAALSASLYAFQRGNRRKKAAAMTSAKGHSGATRDPLATLFDLRSGTGTPFLVEDDLPGQSGTHGHGR
jgi:hypothetical protein